MFRIHFDHKVGKFIIQVLWFNLFWRTVKKELDDLTFDTLGHAEKYAADTGLAKLYVNKSANTRPALFAAYN